jgi:hypothetical protein
LEDFGEVGNMTSEMERAVIDNLEVVVDDDDKSQQMKRIITNVTYFTDQTALYFSGM